MVLQFHREVFSDIEAIMAYYEKESDPHLVDAFYDELRVTIRHAATEPTRYRIITRICAG